MVLPSGNQEKYQIALNQGHSAAWDGRWGQAVEFYNAALKEFPENPSALNSLALAHYELGNLDQALELYQRATRFSPEDPLPVEKSAQIYKQRGDLKKAVDFSMKAADLYLNLRDADKAIHNWTRVTGLEPEHVDAHSRLALVYERLGRTAQAINEHISVASLLQDEGKLEEAQATGEHALSLDPNNADAIQAVELLNNFRSLPKPTPRTGGTSPLQMPELSRPTISTTGQLNLEESPDPVEEAADLAVQQLAGMLFELTSQEEAELQGTGALRSIAKVVAEGLLSRGYDELAISKSLSRAIQLQQSGDFNEAVDELKASIQAGLDHPAAHFYSGYLLSQLDRREDAQLSYQRSVKNSDFTLAARLRMAAYLKDQDQLPDAALQYMRALRAADSAIVEEDQREAIRAQYEPLIETLSSDEDETGFETLCTNIEHLLMRPNWRTSVREARQQLPPMPDGETPAPLADILARRDSSRLVDAMANINRVASAGFPRAAIEESWYTMDFAANYLPLHINQGELMLMQERPQEAIEKFATVARLYSARGESDRATQMYQRIVDVSPLNTAAREHLIGQSTSSGDMEGAIRQTLEMAEVYYRLAQLDEARETYGKALKMVQSTDLESTWTAKILNEMADIDLQRLDWKRALRVYEQLRTLVPNDESTRLKLVQLNLGLGQQSKADTELDNYVAYLISISLDDAVGNFLAEVVEENPDYITGRRRLAEYLQQNGDREAAIKEWNKVGEMLVESGDREGAKIAVRAILSMDPPNAERYRQFLRRIS